MSTAKTSKLHPEVLKLFNSPIYRRKVKRAAEAIKNKHGLHQKKLPRKGNSLAPDLSTVHYFSQLTEYSMERRFNQGGSKSE